MVREFPGVGFERYVDDAVVHCVSEVQAQQVLAALGVRIGEVGLEPHPDKTRIVYCKDSNRTGPYEHTAFTFLGYMFRLRRVRTRSGRMRLIQPPAHAPLRAVREGRLNKPQWLWVNWVPRVW